MTDYTNMSFEDIISHVEVMRLQEETGYRCDAYLHQDQPQVASSNLPQQASVPVDAECRFKMAEWCYQVVDFCKFNRETVAVALSYLDRFLCTPAGHQAREDRKVFQLAAMTSLYTAVKIHEPEAMEPKIIAGLSRGAYTEEQVTDMELSILTALQWRMNPPTALSFAHSFFALLDNEDSISDSEKLAASELAKFQTELAANEYDLVSVAPSAIGLAAVLNAIETVSIADAVKVQEKLCTMIPSMDGSSMPKIQKKLFEIIGNNSTSTFRSHLSPKNSVEKSFGSWGSVHGSPRCVASSQ